MKTRRGIKLGRTLGGKRHCELLLHVRISRLCLDAGHSRVRDLGHARAACVPSFLGTGLPRTGAHHIRSRQRPRRSQAAVCGPQRCWGLAGRPYTQLTHLSPPGLLSSRQLGFGGSVAVKSTPERTGSKRGPPLLPADSGPQSPRAASVHAGSCRPRAALSSRVGPGSLGVLKTVGFARVVAIGVYRFRN